MKKLLTLTAIAALALSPAAFAQTDSMSGDTAAHAGDTGTAPAAKTTHTKKHTHKKTTTKKHGHKKTSSSDSTTSSTTTGQ